MADAPKSRPAPRTPGVRNRANAPVSPDKIPTSVRFAGFGGYVPIILVAAAAIAGVVMLRSPSLTRVGALELGAVLTLGLAWFAFSHRISLKPGDAVRSVFLPLTSLAVLCAITPLALALFPPSREASLTAGGAPVTVSVPGPALSSWIEVRPTLVPSAHEGGAYTVRVTHGGAVETVSSDVRPQVGSAPPARGHVLKSVGAGEYTVQLAETTSPNIALPLTVVMHSRPFTVTGLLAIYIALAILTIVVDVALRRRNVETSFASALWLPLASVLYLVRVPMHDALPSAMAASGAVGFAAAIAAEVVSRIVDGVVPKK